MTTDGVSPGQPRGEFLSQDRQELLRVVGETVSRVLVDSSQHPERLRVSAGDVAVDVRWSRPTAHRGESGPEPDSSAFAHPVEPSGRRIRAETVGVFYRASEPGAAPFVEVGDLVSPGQQLGIIEAMKLMIPVRSDVDGELTRVLVEDGTSVEYDQPLFAIATVNAE
jgi:acetyl-CoA carboxylase biotin carboxyl carrier protein